MCHHFPAIPDVHVKHASRFISGRCCSLTEYGVMWQKYTCSTIQPNKVQKMYQINLSVLSDHPQLFWLFPGLCNIPVHVPIPSCPSHIPPILTPHRIQRMGDLPQRARFHGLHQAFEDVFVAHG